MGRNSGGSNPYNSTQAVIAVNTNGKKVSKATQTHVQSTAESLRNLKYRDTERAIGSAIARYEAVMGIRERNIKIADISGAYGVTFLNQNGSQMIYLSKSAFNVPKKQFEARYKKDNYDTGFKNKTNRPVTHTITHELAHATWTSHYTSPKHLAAGKEIQKLYKSWSKDKKKKDYGSYGKTNVDEFWAEVITKGIHGKSDKYTKKAIGIAKKYKL